MSAVDRRRLMAVALLVAIANALDLLSTYLASPNLANEWNVLERTFGWGWAGLFGAKLLGGCLAVAGYAYYLRHRYECFPEPGLPKEGFCRYFAFGNELGVAGGAAPKPSHLIVNLGYLWAGMQALVIWVALDNLMLRYGFYWSVRFYSELAYHIVQSWLVAGFVLWRLYAGNYSRYLRQSTVLESVPVRATA